MTQEERASDTGNMPQEERASDDACEGGLKVHAFSPLAVGHKDCTAARRLIGDGSAEEQRSRGTGVLHGGRNAEVASALSFGAVCLEACRLEACRPRVLCSAPFWGPCIATAGKGPWVCTLLLEW
jgi:hypothetical protein